MSRELIGGLLMLLPWGYWIFLILSALWKREKRLVVTLQLLIFLACSFTVGRFIAGKSLYTLIAGD